MIEVKNLTKLYNEFKAIDDVSFKINKGEVVGLLGPNGAGKSTTMKLISGYLIPDVGEVLINGKSLNNFPIKLKKIIGYMPENNPLYKDMLVFEAIKLSLNLHGIYKEKEKKLLKKITEEVGLSEVFYKSIGELSKGFRQRVGLAIAMCFEPEILILDEPTEGLDPNQRNDIRELIKKIGKDKTVIISTHVMQEVEAVCSRIILLNKGKIIKDDLKENFGGGKVKTYLLSFEILNNYKPLKKDFEATSFEKLMKNKNEYVYKLTVKSERDFINSINSLIRSNKIELIELKKED